MSGMDRSRKRSDSRRRISFLSTPTHGLSFRKVTFEALLSSTADVRPCSSILPAWDFIRPM